MDDRLINRLESYRARVFCLDKPHHVAIWKDQPPLAFTRQVDEVRTLIHEMNDAGGKQSAGIGGVTIQKRRERRELEEAAWVLGGAITAYAREDRNETLATRHHRSRSAWRRLRDQALLGAAGVLADDARALVDPAAGAAPVTIALAAEYGIDPDSVAAFESERDDFRQWIAASTVARLDRRELGRRLIRIDRAIRQKFAQLESLLPLFGATPEGKVFLATYRASKQVIDRGS